MKLKILDNFQKKNYLFRNIFLFKLQIQAGIQDKYFPQKFLEKNSSITYP